MNIDPSWYRNRNSTLHVWTLPCLHMEGGRDSSTLHVWTLPCLHMEGGRDSSAYTMIDNHTHVSRSHPPYVSMYNRRHVMHAYDPWSISKSVIMYHDIWWYMFTYWWVGHGAWLILTTISIYPNIWWYLYYTYCTFMIQTIIGQVVTCNSLVQSYICHNTSTQPISVSVKVVTLCIMTSGSPHYVTIQVHSPLLFQWKS